MEPKNWAFGRTRTRSAGTGSPGRFRLFLISASFFLDQLGFLVQRWLLVALTSNVASSYIESFCLAVHPSVSFSQLKVSLEGNQLTGAPLVHLTMARWQDFAEEILDGEWKTDSRVAFNWLFPSVLATHSNMLSFLLIFSHLWAILRAPLLQLDPLGSSRH